MLLRPSASASRLLSRPVRTLLLPSSCPSSNALRRLTTAPKAGSILLERQHDRPLPVVGIRRSTLLSLPLFLVVLGISTAALFNYQKSSSSVVASTLYALRVHPEARELLGEEISFSSKMPWVSGTLSQLHGDIDISYRVKGSKAQGRMHFKSIRRTRMGLFDTLAWELVMDDGRKLVLLENSAADPFPQPESA